MNKCLRALLSLALMMLSPICLAQEPSLNAGDQYSMAVNKDGVLFAWGLNSSGQLGNGTTTSSSRPVRITGINAVAQIAAGGGHVLARLADNSVWAWGQNGSGQLGDNTKIPRTKPGKVPGLSNIIEIAAGQGFSLALRDDHTLWAWGRNNFGQLGDGTKLPRSAPVQIILPNPQSDFTGFIQIAAGAYHSMALDNKGRIYSWGDNFYGQLGVGQNIQAIVPTFVANIETSSRIYAGFATSYSVSVTKLVSAWGLNTQQQLGLRDANNRFTPVCISKGCLGVPEPTAMFQVNALYVGYNHVLARDVTQDLYYWGLNAMGQLGNQPTEFLPVEYPTKNTTTTPLIASTMTAFAGGDAHTLGINAEGYVYAWGSNSAGQLGASSTEAFNKVPAQVLSLTGVDKLNLRVSIAAGSDRTPDGFIFAPVTGAGLQSEIRSGEIMITGIDAPTDVSVVGGEYSVNPGVPIDASGFRSSIGTVNSGDRIVVRHFSAPSAGQKTSTTLTVGTTSGNFESTTQSANATGSESGGGCTLAEGQRDLSLALLLLACAALAFFKKLSFSERRKLCTS